MHLIGKIIFVLRKKQHGGHHRGIRCPPSWGVSDTPHDAPMLFFDNLVKNLTSTLEICINNLLILFFFGSGPPPTLYQRSPPPPETTLYQRPPPLKIILMPNIFNKTQHIYLQSMFRLSLQSNAYSFNMKYTYN